AVIDPRTHGLSHPHRDETCARVDQEADRRTVDAALHRIVAARVGHETQFLPAFWSSIALRLNLDGCGAESDATLGAIDLDRCHFTLEGNESYALARPLAYREGLRHTAVHKQNRTIAEHTCQFDLGGKHACG